MSTKNIVKEFREALKRDSTDIGSMYHHLFSMISDSELEMSLSYWLGEYKDCVEGWYSGFHKSLRQGDFFDVHSYNIVNKLTPEQEVRRKEILELREKEWEKFKILHPDEDWDKYKAFKTQFEDKKALAELNELNKLRRFQEETSINGHLDMLLWNTIHLDEKDLLKKTMICVFELSLETA
jgi:hypothetical protein